MNKETKKFIESIKTKAIKQVINILEKTKAKPKEKEGIVAFIIKDNRISRLGTLNCTPQQRVHLMKVLHDTFDEEAHKLIKQAKEEAKVKKKQVSKKGKERGV